MSFILDEEKTWIQRDFGLDRRLVKALSKMGYIYPTLVQSKCLPIALQGKDILVRARTGSGKTVAFGLPLLQKLLVERAAASSSSSSSSARGGGGGVSHTFGIVLAPTKELCGQIEKCLLSLSYYCKDVASVVSIVDDNATVVQYKLQNSKPDIIVSTPAKLIQQIQSGKIDLSQAKTLVIDEADLVLSFGYADEVQAITSKMPKIFQGILMSATLSPDLDKFKRVILNNPAILKLEEAKTQGNLLQFYLQCTERDKFLVLYVFLKLGLLQGKGLIFVNDVDKCYRLKLFLQQFFISSAVLNAEMPLNSRLHIIEEFNRGVFDYLIATDTSIDGGNEDEHDSSDEGEEEAEEDEAGGDDGEDDDDDEEEDNDDNEDDDDDEEEDDDEEDDSNAKPADVKGKKDKVSSSSSSSIQVSSKEKEKEKPKSQMSRETLEGYGVARGLDFQNVAFVVNFDFPVTSASYTHRVGRTARAGASGTALSLVSIAPSDGSRESLVETAARDAELLREVRSQQPRLGVVDGDNVLAAIGSIDDSDANMHEERLMQPSPLVFNMTELETFRYRVDDTLRSVTGSAVKSLRSAELKREILNSKKLKSFFANNSTDFAILRHDAAISHPIKQKEHLKFVPDYLIPQSMRGVAHANDTASKKRKRRKVSGDSNEKIKKSKARDPLQSKAVYGGGYEDDDDNNNGGGDNDGDDDDGDVEKDNRVFSNHDLKNMSNRSLSGRKQWKLRHGKGEYNSYERKKIVKNNINPGSFLYTKKKKIKKG